MKYCLSIVRYNHKWIGNFLRSWITYKANIPSSYQFSYQLITSNAELTPVTLHDASADTWSDGNRKMGRGSKHNFFNRRETILVMFYRVNGLGADAKKRETFRRLGNTYSRGLYNIVIKFRPIERQKKGELSRNSICSLHALINIILKKVS